MGNGLISYCFENGIYVEASGYYWKFDKELSSTLSSSGSYSMSLKKTERRSFKILINQPDNAFGIQWLIAYSYTGMKVESSISDVYLPDDFRIESFVDL